nr:hypothetical protein [Acetobacter sicerae]
MPTQSAEALIGIGVSGAIGFDFVTPKLRVALRPRGVLWAAMPEAPVNEDG